jgi:U3 small nucleolar RNA-associated protein 11
VKRGKWGLLEKHKDYSLRAKDHKEKRKRLKILREKASERNPDEFSFAMMSSKTLKGVKVGDRGNKALSHDVVMLLKTQDAGYLRTVLQKTKLERQKAENAFALTNTVESTAKPRKIFVDSIEEQAQFVDEDDAQDEWDDSESDDKPRPETLRALKKREQELATALLELDLQKARMSNSIGGVNKNGVKYKVRSRKR